MRSTLCILALLLVSLPVVAQANGDTEAVYKPTQFVAIVGVDAVFAVGKDIHVVPVRDLNVRGQELVVPYPMRSILPGTGFGVAAVHLVTRGDISHSAWATPYALQTMRMIPVQLLATPAPTYTSSYTDTRGITHTVTTPQKKFPGKWEKAEDWARRHHDALQGLLTYFPPKKG